MRGMLKPGLLNLDLLKIFRQKVYNLKELRWVNVSNQIKNLEDEKLLNKILEDAKKLPTSELLNHALYEKDPARKAVFKALYEYVIDERQTKIINEKGFVI